MDSEWGPWIEHDGSGCPIGPGVHCQVQWADGMAVECTNYGQSARQAGIEKSRPYNGPRYKSSWTWTATGTKIPVARYRIRRPRALQSLIDLVENLTEEERL